MQGRKLAGIIEHDNLYRAGARLKSVLGFIPECAGRGGKSLAGGARHTLHELVLLAHYCSPPVL